MFARGALVQQKRQDKSMYLPTMGADLNKAESSGPENSGCHSCRDWVKKALGSIWGNGLSGWEGFLFSAQKREPALFLLLRPCCTDLSHSEANSSSLCWCTHTFHIARFQTRCMPCQPASGPSSFFGLAQNSAW